MTSIVVALLLCVAAVLAVSMQIRCVDAAREAARLAARGDSARAGTAASRVAPGGARITVSVGGEYASATVVARSRLLPLITIRATATAAAEPGTVS